MKRILVCPLDWGLGHATRCIPVIQELRRQGAEVLVASSGSALALLKLEFPDIRFFELPGYRPRYAENIPLAMKLFYQLPKFLKVVKEEHRILENLIQELSIDIVISDNRYGCWSARIKSVLITHQINVLMPRGYGWASTPVNRFVQTAIRKFSAVWIPDQPGSGLTAPFKSRHFQHPVYIGWLSRFRGRREKEMKYQVLALVSGPEPQRSVLEKILLSQLKEAGIQSLLVAGEPGNPYRKQDGCVERVNHLSTGELEEAILSSAIVVCRSGYSTVMDLIALGKKAIFIPTPQQPEQIFLAEHLMAKHIAFTEDQRKFSLRLALESSRPFKGLSCYTMESGFLSHAVTALMQ
jgi:uncharacterized protein (TIGR00661 family)